jgi:hypothetical protein
MKKRIKWSERERDAVVAGARKLVAAGRSIRVAYNEAQAFLPRERQRLADYESQMSHDVRALLVAQASVGDSKFAADLSAAEALLGEQAQQLAKLRAERDELRAAHERDAERLREATAAQASGEAVMQAVVGLAVTIAKRVALELGVSTMMRPGDCPPARVPNPGVPGGETPVRAATSSQPPAKKRVLIFAGSDEPHRAESKWKAGIANDVEVRVERARPDGRVFVPHGFDAALLVHGVRHATSEQVRRVYLHAPLASGSEVPRVLSSIVNRLRGQ